MIESALFESAVRVIDRFIELLKYRQTKRKEFFLEIIEPLFNDLMVMHTDYITMFDDCRSQLFSNAPLSEVAEELRKRRSTYEGLRVKAQAITESLRTADVDPEIKRFLMVAAFHIPTGEISEVSTVTTATSILRRLYTASELMDVPILEGRAPVGDRKDILNMVIDTSNNIRQRWAVICETYIRAKIWSLK